MVCVVEWFYCVFRDFVEHIRRTQRRRKPKYCFCRRCRRRIHALWCSDVRRENICNRKSTRRNRWRYFICFFILCKKYICRQQRRRRRKWRNSCASRIPCDAVYGRSYERRCAGYFRWLGISVSVRWEFAVVRNCDFSRYYYDKRVLYGWFTGIHRGRRQNTAV